MNTFNVTIDNSKAATGNVNQKWVVIRDMRDMVNYYTV